MGKRPPCELHWLARGSARLAGCGRSESHTGLGKERNRETSPEEAGLELDFGRRDRHALCPLVQTSGQEEGESQQLRCLGPRAHRHPAREARLLLPFLGAATEAQTGDLASWGHTRKGGVQSQGSNPEACAVSHHSSLHTRPHFPSVARPFPPSRGLFRGTEPSVEALTSLVLFTPPQKSCTCRPGRRACPAASARSTPWPSCAPTSGRAPIPTPVASRSSSLPAEKPLQQAPGATYQDGQR